MRHRRHPFPVLLYVEWILLAIALLVVFAPPSPPGVLRQLVARSAIERPAPDRLDRPGRLDRPDRPPPDNLRQRRRWQRARERQAQRAAHRAAQRWRILPCILALGLSGLRVPQAPWQRLPHIALGFGICWLALFLGGYQNGTLFPALLLVVVIRACLVSGWFGRIAAVAAAYISFLVPLGIRLSLIQTRVPKVPAELAPAIEQALYSFALNSALLYAFVLAFVLLLVGALLAERQSQQQLTRANQRLRDYARLSEERATLQERNRIARELHDSIGHHLIAQSIQLENVALFLSEARDRAADHLEKARQLGKAALSDIRNSVATLKARPAAASGLADPLAIAVSKLLQGFDDPGRCQAIGRIDLAAEPSPPVAMALYRVVQEALSNVAKHARASRIEVSLGDRAGTLELTVTDNGCGFEPAENATGFGLQNMRERVEALGGHLEVRSQPGSGCAIVAKVPPP